MAPRHCPPVLLLRGGHGLEDSQHLPCHMPTKRGPHLKETLRQSDITLSKSRQQFDRTTVSHANASGTLLSALLCATSAGQPVARPNRQPHLRRVLGPRCVRVLDFQNSEALPRQVRPAAAVRVAVGGHEAPPVHIDHTARRARPKGAACDRQLSAPLACGAVAAD